MPRLPTSLIRRARAEHPFLPLLLRPCRDLLSARNELRWLREHAIANRTVTHTSLDPTRTSWRLHLHRMCHERARGKPLQYILGTQPFGTLEILCRKGVLIPRPETETITTHLATLLLSSPPKPLRILDLCTGTGCIPLHLHSLLTQHIPTLCLHGLDISPLATSLARSNLTHNTHTKTLLPSALSQITFATGDIFAAPTSAAAEKWRQDTWDILVSNPPYISPTSYQTTTSRSVRNYEPKLALVPPYPPSSSSSSNTTTHNPPPPPPTTDPSDTFYPRLLSIAEQISAQVVLFEVGDMQQALRVAGMVVDGTGRGEWKGCEIWRDWPGGVGGGEGVVVRGERVGVRGEGNGRAVLAWRGERGGGMVGR
ncbi:S-adenosyl-L-methionine-dependent methyltransferase [Usnea florida]